MSWINAAIVAITDTFAHSKRLWWPPGSPQKADQHHTQVEWVHVAAIYLRSSSSSRLEQLQCFPFINFYQGHTYGVEFCIQGMIISGVWSVVNLVVTLGGCYREGRERGEHNSPVGLPQCFSLSFYDADTWIYTTVFMLVKLNSLNSAWSTNILYFINAAKWKILEMKIWRNITFCLHLTNLKKTWGWIIYILWLYVFFIHYFSRSFKEDMTGDDEILP